MQRTEQSLKNTIVSIGIQIGTVLLNFISRTALIKTLGEQYLGVNGLFSNILTMLSMVELGVGSALIYLMYKPMADKDEERLGLLMRAYGKIYTSIGMIILALGVSLTPFLHLFMKETPDIENLTIIYVLYVLNMALTYFFSYRAAIINVAQKNYIVNLIRFGFTAIQYVVQIAILFLFRNYILYYACTLAGTILGNWAVYLKAGQMFPFIRGSHAGKLTGTEKKEIKKSIFAMFFHRMGTFVVFGTDNLIISKFVGIIEVGLYSNYTMITNALMTAVNLIFTSLTASIGHLVSHEKKERTYEVFKDILFANSWMIVFCAVSLYVLFNPFITLWVGEKYTFSNLVVAVIVLNFYITHMRFPANVFKEVCGLFWNDRYKSVIESIVNLVFSLYLVKHWGILGVLVGTTISSIGVCFWVEPYVLYKRYFKKSLWDYFALVIKYSLIGLGSILIIQGISNCLTVGAFLGFVIQLLLCLFVPNTIFIVLFKNKPEFQYFIQVFAKITRKWRKQS